MNSMNGQMLYRVVMCLEHGISVSASDSGIPVTNPALAPNSLALRMTKEHLRFGD